jgi:hypothetical protein
MGHLAPKPIQMHNIHVTKKEIDNFFELKDAFINHCVSELDKYPHDIETMIESIWGYEKKNLNIKEIRKLVCCYLVVNKLTGDTNE